MSDQPQNQEKRRIDARGLRCPEPLMLVRNKIRAMSPGETVEVLATDPTTTRDLTHFCHFMKHEMVSSQTSESVLRFVIRKSGG